MYIGHLTITIIWKYVLKIIHCSHVKGATRYIADVDYDDVDYDDVDVDYDDVDYIKNN